MRRDWGKKGAAHRRSLNNVSSRRHLPEIFVHAGLRRLPLQDEDNRAAGEAAPAMPERRRRDGAKSAVAGGPSQTTAG